MLIFLILLFVFVPNQEKYYVDSDIKNFEDKYYSKFSLLISLVLTIIVLIFGIIKKKTVKTQINNLIGITIFCLWFFVLFQSILIGFALFINRQSNVEEVVKNYKILYISRNQSFLAYNLKNEKEYIDDETYKKIHKTNNLRNLENGKVLKIIFNKGILGVNYIPE